MMKVDIKEIVQKILEADKAYYVQGRPTITDQEYDALKELIKSTEPNHPILEKVGQSAAGPWETVAHDIPMGSQHKVNSEEEFLKWAAKFDGELLSIQLKCDGASLSLNYEDGELMSAITRGDGTEGEDVSQNVRRMKNFIPTLKKNYSGSVRAEVMMTREDFEKINELLMEEDRYENPRNAVAGILRRLDGRYCSQLFLLAYDLTDDLDEDQKMAKLAELGFDCPWHKEISALPILIKYFEEIGKRRPDMKYNIDGAVIKVCSRVKQDEAGTSGGRPKHQIAWKFDPPGSATVFLHETWEVGRTGVVTPLAWLEPVKIDGSTIKKATLHNVAEIKRLGIGRGDLINITKRGDIIPKIESVIEHKGEPIVIPTRCPSCQSALENDGTRLFCRNEQCPGRNFYRILNWIKVAKIDNLGESLVHVLRDSGKVTCIKDIYSLAEHDISFLEGWGESSATTIISFINETRSLKPEIFLAAVGVPGISERTSEDLIKAFKTIEGVLEAKEEDIKVLKGYSDISAASIVAGLATYREEIEDLMGVISTEAAAGGKLEGMAFCFTGAMGKPRQHYQKMVDKCGGRNLNSVTKELTHLVMNEDKGSSKSRKAAKYGTKIISEQDFLDMVGEIPEEEKPKALVEMPSLFE